MLAFVATDATVSREALQACVHAAVSQSFNRITVDGDTSTNDSCVLVATGLSGAPLIGAPQGSDYDLLLGAVTQTFQELAQAIVRDAEGATKFITIHVVGAENEGDALAIAYTVAHSPLVKTAFFASDPNWGRILAAVGRAPIVRLDAERVTIHLDNVCVVRNGALAPDYTEAQGQAVMKSPEIRVTIGLNAGPAEATVWTSDLSHEYVSINADYRS
jgi:glutamate N-acetyltransferase/amino-acid N-acetyltransferase